MTKKVYRSARGKTVDIGLLQLQNEHVRAVGNMGVNARGDLIDSQNRTIEKRSTAVGKQYKKQSNNVVDEPVVASSRKAKQQAQAEKTIKSHAQPEVQPQIVDSQDPIDETVAVTEPAPVEEPLDTSGGLAAAIARARQVKQEPLKTPRQLAQEKKGVTKL